MSTIISDNPTASRYEIWLDDQRLGFTVYQPKDGIYAFTHTEIDPAHEGKGYASQLVRYALDDVRNKNGQVIALCPYVARWIDRHPEYQDLLAQR